jgi:hypothetical protein
MQAHTDRRSPHLLDILTVHRMHFRLPKIGSVSNKAGVAGMEIDDGPVRLRTEPDGSPSE